MNNRFILWYDQISYSDKNVVGGKNSYIGELYKKFQKKINIPNGFVLTIRGYEFYIMQNELENDIKKIISTINVKNIRQLQEKGNEIRQLVLNAKFPEELSKEILEAYKKLGKRHFKDPDVALRSSVTLNGIPDPSFEEIQETFLNIQGEYNLIDACKRAYASLFTNRAITYIIENKLDLTSISISVGIQKMIRSDLGSSGYLYTMDNKTGFKNSIHILSFYGISDKAIFSYSKPDEFYVFKPTLPTKDSIISKKLGEKTFKKIYNHQGTSQTKIVPVDISNHFEFTLNETEIITLSKWALELEKHFEKIFRNQEGIKIEFAKDGENGRIYILEVLPERIHTVKDPNIITKYKLEEEGKILAIGESIGHKIGQGRANVLKDIKQGNAFRKGQVLVTDMTDPDWEPIMKLASGIVLNNGGRTCHAAIFSRELGIPCIVGTKNSTVVIKSGQNITVDCTSGNIFEGILDFKAQTIDIKKVPKTKTKVMLNISTPEQAMKLSSLPNDGVGLARSEFIIDSYIQIHPKALVDYEKLEDPELIAKIDTITAGYPDKKKFFIDKFAYGIALIASSFYPKEVIVRLTDFHTNEYRNLLGGELYEFKEENPMIGFRGASRYYSKNYRDAFNLECKALKKVRDEMGLTNVKIMIPFCRTPEEGKKVIDIMAKNGLKQGKNGLKVIVTCEIPSNIILADRFCKIFDGFSIGSNDLTQLTLGLDRDSEPISYLYDEKDESLKRLIKTIISTAKKNKKEVGFCGDAPSSIPGFAEFLVSLKIDSISLTPDTILKTILHVARAEERLARGKKIYSIE